MKFRISNSKAQTMLANGIIFFVILLLCSSLIFTSALKIVTQKPSNYRLKYAEQAINILISATIPKCWYIYNNENITIDNKSIGYLIIFDLWCRSNKTANITTLENGIEEPIKILADNLICYSYALLATYNSTALLISSYVNNLSELPIEHTISAITEKMFYLPGEATISLIIW
ncbi:MAG: hypothetical protein QMD21_04135 [Candidatus Thermoplasmatota archaeon]|nr:hypothetical protein [Candidatus Thermoplasmatota archaeon]MDI6887782.1 hypothetical protein [Candidatus Thermoplasmatota archaeon]